MHPNPNVSEAIILVSSPETVPAPDVCQSLSSQRIMEENCADQMFKTVTVPTKYGLEQNQSWCDFCRHRWWHGWWRQQNVKYLKIQRPERRSSYCSVSDGSRKQPGVFVTLWPDCCGGLSCQNLSIAYSMQLLTRDRDEQAGFQRESLDIQVVTDDMQAQKRGANQSREPV